MNNSAGRSPSPVPLLYSYWSIFGRENRFRPVKWLAISSTTGGTSLDVVHLRIVMKWSFHHTSCSSSRMMIRTSTFFSNNRKTICKLFRDGTHEIVFVYGSFCFPDKRNIKFRSIGVRVCHSRNTRSDRKSLQSLTIIVLPSRFCSQPSFVTSPRNVAGEPNNVQEKDIFMSTSIFSGWLSKISIKHKSPSGDDFFRGQFRHPKFNADRNCSQTMSCQWWSGGSYDHYGRIFSLSLQKTMCPTKGITMGLNY